MDRPNITIILGKSGSGKTYKAIQLINERPRVLIFDTLGHDYVEGVVFDNLQQLKRFWVRCYRSNFRLIYRPYNEVEEFDEIARLAYECGDLTLVCEELDIYARPNAICRGLRDIIKRGRHRDIRFIGTSQRPFGIDRIITALATDVFVFRTEEPRDLEYLAERFGSGIEKKIVALEDYQWVLARQGSTVYEVGKDL